MQNLRVCDAGVFSQIPATHLLVPVVMLTEECSTYYQQVLRAYETKGGDHQQFMSSHLVPLLLSTIPEQETSERKCMLIYIRKKWVWIQSTRKISPKQPAGARGG